ncbi:MAG: preprotein translocase subunit SecE [Verrucomicrobiota bacterium]
MLKKTTTFLNEVKIELKKANWPWEPKTKERGFKRFKELSDSTVVVIVAMLLLGGFVSLFDLIMRGLIQAITSF